MKGIYYEIVDGNPCSIVPGKHEGNPVFQIRCMSWGFWSHLFDLSPSVSASVLESIQRKNPMHDREWGGHHFRSHPRVEKDGHLVHVQARTIITLPDGATYLKKRYQVSDRTVLYFLKYGVVRDIKAACGERFCVAPEHQQPLAYATEVAT